MSHMIAMNMPKIKNLKCLEKACKSLGLTLDTNRKEALYYAGQRMKCDAVISSPKAKYEIALTKKHDGSYDVHMDSFDSSLCNIVGRNCGLLSRAYQIEDLKRRAKLQGKEILGCKTNAQGIVELTIRG